MGNVLISTKLIQVLTPSTIDAKGFVTVYDGGSLSSHQIVFRGKNTIRSGFTPISFNSPSSTSSGFNTISFGKSKLSFLSLPRAFKDTSTFSSLVIEEGELILQTGEDLLLFTDSGARISIKKGACVYVLNHKDGLIVRNFADHSSDSVVIQIGKHQLCLPIGWEFRWNDSSTEQLPCREKAKLNGLNAEFAEFSLAGMFTRNKLTKTFMNSFPEEANWIVKTAACLGVLRNSKGPFHL